MDWVWRLLCGGVINFIVSSEWVMVGDFFVFIGFFRLVFFLRFSRGIGRRFYC